MTVGHKNICVCVRVSVSRKMMADRSRPLPTHWLLSSAAPGPPLSIPSWLLHAGAWKKGEGFKMQSDRSRLANSAAEGTPRTSGEPCWCSWWGSYRWSSPESTRHSSHDPHRNREQQSKKYKISIIVAVLHNLEIIHFDLIKFVSCP